MIRALRDKVLHPVQANILYLFMACGMLLQGPLFSALFGGEYTLTQYYLFTIAMELLLIGLPSFILLRSRGADAKIFSATPQAWQIALIVPLVFIGMFMISSLTALVSLLVLHLGGTPLASTPLLADPSDGPMVVLMLLAVSFVPALCEEAAFRGLVYHAYQPYGRLRAVAMSGVLFALLHGSPLALPGHLCLGIALGLLMFWTGSIWVPIIYHLLHNAFATLFSMNSGNLPGTRGLDQATALQQLNNPMALLVLAGMCTFLLALYIGLLALLYALSKRRSPLAPLPPRLELRPSWLLPLLPALALAAYQYVRMGVYMFAG